jgi:methionyl-tRNA formyltransferase
VNAGRPPQGGRSSSGDAASRVVFAGTPPFALAALEALLAAGFETPLVLTQPDRPAGRGLRLQPSPVKAFAMHHAMRVLQPSGLGQRHPKDVEEVRDVMRRIEADAMVVAAYGLLLPQWLLDLPRWGCINIHASLLPRWRGAAPIQRAVEAGDTLTGVTIMQMDAGLDSGEILLAEPMPIAVDDTAGSLQHKLAGLGARLVVQALHLRAQGRLPGSPQPIEGVTYAHKVQKSEALIDWNSPAAQIVRRVRAFDPAPGCTTQLGGVPIKVWGAALDGQALAPGARAGQVLDSTPDALIVAARDGAVRLTQLQRAGGKRLGARDFLLGFPVQAGAILGA